MTLYTDLFPQQTFLIKVYELIIEILLKYPEFCI